MNFKKLLNFKYTYITLLFLFKLKHIIYYNRIKTNKNYLEFKILYNI